MFIPIPRFGNILEVGAPVCEASALAREVERRAAALAALGVAHRARVAILHSNSVRFFADLFAVWRVGAVAACIDGALTESELKTILQFVKPATVLVDGDAPLRDAALRIADLTDARPPSRIAAPLQSELDDPALILFTSGTTGAPKGVVLSHRAILARISLNIAAIGKATLSRALVTLPTHFGHGLIGNALTPLMAGGDIILHPRGIGLAQNLGKVIDEHRIRFMSSVPTFWRMALNGSEPPSGNSLARVHVGSAPLSAQLWSDVAAWSRAEVVNCYGITETANWIGGASSRADGIAEGLVGRPWGGTIAVRDEDGTVRTVGEGEIVVQSPSLMSGYLDRPDLTEAALTDGWYRTGDFGSVDAQGTVRITGRIKDEINHAGFKIHPAEIDRLLESHPAVAEACVFGAQDLMSGEMVCAAVKLKAGAAASAEDLRDWCRQRLRQASIPERWFVVDDIPRNARGKVSREAVRRALIQDATSGVERVETRAVGVQAATNGRGDAATAGRVRSAVERAWTQALDRKSFAANQRWEEAGGDSLKALHFWFLIESDLGVRLPLDALSNRVTPTEIVAALETFLRTATQELHGNAEAGSAPLVFFLPPAEGDTPTYARFRAAFNGAVRFKVIDYPPWREMIDSGAGFEVMADAAVRQIVGSRIADPLHLAGYSFGGLVAWETARRLTAMGRKVGFLGLIDTQTYSMSAPRKSLSKRAAKFVKMLGSSGGRFKLRQFGVSSVLGSLLHLRAFSLLRGMERSVALLPSKAAFKLQLRLIQHLRMNSLKRWQAQPLNISATLFRSDDFHPESVDHGWNALCDRLTIVPISGSHLSLFDPPTRELLCERFLQAVEDASPGRQSAGTPAPRAAADPHALDIPR